MHETAKKKHKRRKTLTDLYIDGEESYSVEEGDKMTTVFVERKQYRLSQDALSEFENIHDEWEMSICQKYPHDALVGGKQ